jgi:DNA-binding response OmpR family regulator
MNILIVEDDKMVATYLSHELQLSGHATTIASDGIMGLQYCSNQDFDLCIVDLLLPGNSGFEILNTIQHMEDGYSHICDVTDQRCRENVA